MYITYIIYQLQFTLIDYISHVFLHTQYGKTTIFGRSHIYHHKFPDQVNWLGSPPNLYIYHRIYVIDQLLSLFYENTYFYPYALYFASHYYLYGTITNPTIVFLIHMCEALIGHALIHKNIIKNELFNKIHSRSHSMHHVNPHSNYAVGWCIIWDVIFGTYQ
jgi:hypothetical protein